jgi:hypothetical protein
MKKTQLKEIIKSALKEIKTAPGTTPTELFKEVSSELTPFHVYFLLNSANVDDFLDNWIDDSNGLEAGFENEFGLDLNSYRPKLEALYRLAEQKEIEVLFILGEDIQLENYQYDISDYSYLTTIKDDDYDYVYLSKFPLK